MKHLLFVSILIILVSSCASVDLGKDGERGSETFEYAVADPVAFLQEMHSQEAKPSIIPELMKSFDTDLDGLTNEKELLTGTDANNSDTDSDGISDYDEVTKYFLDPLNADSDMDGIPDNDIEERREFTHSVKAVCTIKYPYNLRSMNNHYQDVIPLQENNSVLTYQVIFYPEAYHILEEFPFTQDTDSYSGLERFLLPDPIMNFDEEMSHETRQQFLLYDNMSDLDIVKEVYRWQKMYVTEKPKYSGSGGYPAVQFGMYVTEDNKIKYTHHFTNNETWRKIGNKEWLISHLLLGKDMFRNRTRGSCGSTSIFYTTILRSLGIPARISVMVPIVDYDSSSQLHLLNALSDETKTMITKRESTDHFVCEAFIGNRWIIVDMSQYRDRVKMEGSFIKVVDFDSWKHVDFVHDWEGIGVQGRNPYKLIYIEEQYPIHQPQKYQFFMPFNPR